MYQGAFETWTVVCASHAVTHVSAWSQKLDDSIVHVWPPGHPEQLDQTHAGHASSCSVVNGAVGHVNVLHPQGYSTPEHCPARLGYVTVPTLTCEGVHAVICSIHCCKPCCTLRPSHTHTHSSQTAKMATAQSCCMCLERLHGPAKHAGALVLDCGHVMHRTCWNGGCSLCLFADEAESALVCRCSIRMPLLCILACVFLQLWFVWRTF